MAKARGFEVVKDDNRINLQYVTALGKALRVLPDITLPTRADARSAGYDFYNPVDVQILPNEQTTIFTDVKAYMQEDEVLKIYPRSSLSTKKGIVLANTTGIIDASYYGNPDNDGNIGIVLKNTSHKAVNISAGERIAQGIFTKYLTADVDTPLKEEREGGFGSSGE